MIRDSEWEFIISYVAESVVLVHEWSRSQRRLILMISTPHGQVKVPQ